MDRDPNFDSKAAAAYIDEALIAALESHVRAGLGLITARAHGELACMTERLEISELHAQLMLQAGERFEALTAAGQTPRDALLSIRSDKAFMNQLISHSAQHMEVMYDA